MRIRIMGAGSRWLDRHFRVRPRGLHVEVIDRREGPGLGCSYFAGGMLAPWCEAESTEKLILDLGLESLKFWTEESACRGQHGYARGRARPRPAGAYPFCPPRRRISNL